MWIYPYKTLPYEHQRNALKESAEKKNWAYFMEWVQVKQVTIDNIGFLFLQRKIDTCLIIAPKSVYLIGNRMKLIADVIKYRIYKWNMINQKIILN